MNFNKIRNNLLKEAKSSPDLLSNIGGLENYIGETYNYRYFIKLSQNVDDSSSTKFKILKISNYLFVADN
jgi:hypothetical protein